MEKAKVKWATNHGTAQIYSSGVELAICSDENEQIGTFVYCKDFFQDAVVVYLHGGICNIYGYKYDPKTMPKIPEKNLKVLITSAKDTQFPKKVAVIPEFLNQIEEKLGVEKTTIFECEEPPEKYQKSGIYLMIADKKWLLAPPLLSLWTLLARNGIRHKEGDSWETTIQNIIDKKCTAAQKHDATYLKYAKPGLDLLLEKGFDALFGENQKKNYPKSKAGHAMHHYSGAVSFGSCKAKAHFPDWIYPAKETNPPAVCFS